MAKSESPVSIREAKPADEPRWRELWDAYTRFYEREPREDITHHTWSRIMDSNAPVYAIVAESPEGEILGIANYLTHESTSHLTPCCYLQDLIVDRQSRGAGVGAALIDWLILEMKSQRWSRLYWNTKENNYRARTLYDRYTLQSGFVRYVIPNPDL